MNELFFLPRRCMVWAILFISNLFKSNQLRACRFHPSCSVYSVQAFNHVGFFRAFLLMTKRILKCHPFSSGGYDPLPICDGANV